MFDLLLLGGLNKTIIREGSKHVSSMSVDLERTIGIRNLLIIVAIIACIISSFFTNYELQTKLYIIIFSFQLAYIGVKGFVGTIYQATEKMQYISIFGIANRILFVSLSIAFLSYGFGLLTLFSIALFSNILTLIINYKFSQKFVKFNIFSRIQFDKKLLKPALIFSLIAFLGFLTTRIDLLMISFLGTAKDVGIYAVAQKITQQGIMLRNVTAIAFFPIFVKRFYNNSMKSRKLLMYSLSFFVAVFIISGTFSFFAKDLIVLLFGTKYENSGEILKFLIFSLALTWAVLPYSLSIQATNNERYSLIIGSITAGLNVPLNYIFFLKYGVIGIVYSTLIVFVIGASLMPIITHLVLKKQGYLI